MNTQSKLICHHVKYKEIHGVDEIIYLTRSDHVLLHKKLRKENKCNIPVKVLTKISTNAYNRRSNSILLKKKYHKKAYTRIDYTDTIGINILLYTSILFNSITGNITVSTRFQGNHGIKLKLIER